MMSLFIWIYAVCTLKKFNFFHYCSFDPIALRRVKIVYNLGLSSAIGLKVKIKLVFRSFYHIWKNMQKDFIFFFFFFTWFYSYIIM